MEGDEEVVECVASPTCEEEMDALLAQDKPLILRGFGAGQKCLQWSVEHLVEHSKDVKHTVHVTRPEHIPATADLTQMTLKELVAKWDDAKNGGKKNSSQERYYLAGPNVMDVAGMETLCSEAENCIAGIIPRNSISCFGIWAGVDGQRTWLHFDCAHNVLLQIRGKKKITLARPDFFPNLYTFTYKSCGGNDMQGEVYRFSEVDVWNRHQEDVLKKYPLSAKVKYLVADLGPGDALLIPLGWWHAVETLGDPHFNVALNIFWDASEEYWAKRKYLKSFKMSYKLKK